MLDGLIAFSHRLSRWATWFGGGLMLCCAVFVSFDVVARKFFGYTVSGSDEITSYAFAVSTSWALTFTLLERYHVRIDALYMMLPRRLCAALDILALMAFLGFVSVLTLQATTVFQTSVQFGSRANTPLQTPLVIPQGLWLIGLIGFTIVIFLLLLRALIALAAGDMRKVSAIAGVRTQAEEVASELSNPTERIT
jgi:TRAP-type mannitol/chloroaromatic compound transport system permease small subunit